MAAVGAAAFKDFSRYAEIVYVAPKKKAKVPRTAWSLRPSGPMQLPWGMVTSPDAGQGLALITNQTIKEGKNREFMRELLARIEEDPSLMDPVSKEETIGERAESQTPASPFPTPVMKWSNADGQVIEAAILKVESGKVHFQLNGQLVPYDFSKLSPESQGKLRSLMEGVD